MSVISIPNLQQIIKKMDILKTFSLRELTELKQYLFYREIKKGQILFFNGDPRERIYFLHDGYVHLEKMNTKGTTRFDLYQKPTSLFPYTGFFTDTYYPMTAEATTDIKILFIPTFHFEAMVKRNKKHLLSIIEMMSKEMLLIEQRAQYLSSSNASERVIQAIAFLGDDLGKQKNCSIEIPCPLKITEIAELSGTSRETASHTINHLIKEEKLSMENKKLILKVPDFFLSSIR